MKTKSEGKVLKIVNKLKCSRFRGTQMDIRISNKRNGMVKAPRLQSYNKILGDLEPNKLAGGFGKLEQKPDLLKIRVPSISMDNKVKKKEWKEISAGKIRKDSSKNIN